jgi:hypothetical protein
MEGGEDENGPKRRVRGPNDAGRVGDFFFCVLLLLNIKFRPN